MYTKMLIGVITTECFTEFQSEIMRGIISQAFKSNCDIAVISSMQNFYMKSAHKNTEKNNEKYVGKTLKILVEGESKTNKEMLTGRLDSNKVVVFEGDKNLINKIIDVKIESQNIWYLKGSIIDTE